MDMVTEYPQFHVSPVRFDPGTAQTPGSVRLPPVALAARHPSDCGAVVRGQAGARTGIHHHGEQQT